MLEEIMLFIGISGVLAIALNFVLEITNKLGKNHRMFAWINLYGSSALLVYSWFFGVWLFVVLNGFLVIIGLYGLWKVCKLFNK